MRHSIIFAFLASIGAVSAQSSTIVTVTVGASSASSAASTAPTAPGCPAPGTTTANGDYSCNPAHKYPEGQACVLEDSCYFLRNTAASSSASAAPSTTACPAPGATSANGDYSCNPAHQYPEGQECVLVNGCYFLRNTASSTASTTPTATSCPAPGTTSSGGDYSCNPAHKYPDGQECVLVNGCYFLRKQQACAAPGTLNNKGQYSCNPAHKYPEGQTCIQYEGCFILCESGSGKPVPKPEPTSPVCPPAGSTNDAGQYSCNPAHKYPEGQTCIPLNGCYILCGSDDGKPVPKPQPSSPICPPAGTINDAGQYSCNPAHKYPEGQNCVPLNGCYVLCKTDDGKPVPPPQPTKSGQPPKPTSTPNCPAPGSKSDKGQYSCNPAHQYPNGQTCQLIDGCYFLVYPLTTTNAPPQPTKTGDAPKCPAPGSTNNKGQYSCNPAHQYPNGQTCQLIDGCYYLVYPSSAPPRPTQTAAPPACPAPGSTNANGDYSCNPAHQYPEGQTCILVNGCYFLRKTGITTVVPPAPTGNGTIPTVVPAGAASFGASSLLAFTAGLITCCFAL